ncbi:MAG TPA: carboxypeptidase, partial [Hanamia sp.]
MKKIFPLILIFVSIGFSSVAQKKSSNNASKNEGSTDNNPMVIVDSSVTTKNTITIKGQTIPYTAKAGTLPIWDKEGKPIASVFYTYYERTDVKDRASRP